MFVFLFTLVGCPQGTDSDTKPGDSGADTSGETGTPTGPVVFAGKLQL